jgi:thiazole synthase
MQISAENCQDFWQIDFKKFTSRLLQCFGSFNDLIDVEMAIKFIKSSETEFLTLYTHGNLETIKRIDDFPIGYSGLQYKNIKNRLDDRKYTLLINTNHSLTVEDTIKRCEIGYNITKSRFVKIEVLNRDLTRPINEEVIEAAKILIDKGFTVLPLINANMHDAILLENIGCSALRVIMSEIGSRKGLVNKEILRKICSAVKIPVISEGGLSGPEDAYNSMVAGASAVLVNKALFCYKEPLVFIDSLKQSIRSGRNAFICNLQKC